jgi:hypothetical protein
MAVMAPKVPTMKYWNSLFCCSLPRFLYFAKLGIFVVSLPPTPLKGLSKELEADTSDKLRRCCIEADVAARRAVEVNGVRVHWHTMLDAFDVSAGIVVRMQWLTRW